MIYPSLTLLHSFSSSSPCSSLERLVIRNQQSRFAEATMRSGMLVSSVGSKRVSQWICATPFMTWTADTGSKSRIPDEGMDANDISKEEAADQERKLEVLEEKSRKVKEANAPFSSGKSPYVPSTTQLESTGVNRPLNSSTQQRR